MNSQCFKASVPASKARAATIANARNVRESTDRLHISRRLAVISTLNLLAVARVAQAEEASSSSPSENRFSEMRRKAKEVSEKNDADFEGSEFLKGLRDKSDANKARYKRELQDRYCYRQAELGVGDCGGLQLIPGATKSGKQKTPEWLKGVLQKLGQLPPDEQGSLTATPSK